MRTRGSQTGRKSAIDHEQLQYCLHGGITDPDMVTIVRYPNRDAVDKVFQNAEYHALREIPEREFLNYQIGIVET